MATVQDVEVKTRPWSPEEFQRLQEVGMISPAAQLLGGTVYENGQPHRWSGEEIFRLLDLGFFEGERFELIEGEIISMAAQKNYHAMGISLSEDALRIAFGPGFWVRVQMSLNLKPYSVPDPDLAVVQGAIRTWPINQNPTSALLTMEVSETTLYYDRNRKGSLYAVAGITDYWILNLVKRQLEVHRDPVVDATMPYGMGYGNVVILGPQDSVRPLAVPHSVIAVADLLP